MTLDIKDHLLKTAKERYPFGTKYYNATYSRTPINIKTVKGELRFHSSTSSPEGHITDGWGGAVYFQGKWAERVEVIKPRTFKLKLKLSNKNQPQ
jgi:hypothetical protein